MTKVTSWLRCEQLDGGSYSVSRDGDPKEIIDMAFGAMRDELFDNMQLFHYARYCSRQMFRDLWKASDTHDKFMYLLDKAKYYAVGVLALLGGICAIGWFVAALERLVLG